MKVTKLCELQFLDVKHFNLMKILKFKSKMISDTRTCIERSPRNST